MAMRTAVLTRHVGLEQIALQAALGEVAGPVDVRVWDAPAAGGNSARGGGDWMGWLPFGALARLALYRPDLVVSEAFGPRAAQAALYRMFASRSRLLLCATERPRRYGAMQRLVLSRADRILADGDDVIDAVELLRFPSSPAYPMAVPADIELFSAGPRVRGDGEAHRLIYAGELSPESGAADVLICVAAWAEQHPDQRAELWWAGEGDLSGVLEAQPLPDNMAQRFLGRLDRAGLAAAFGQCGVLVTAPLAQGGPPLLAEALAAGLVVLGSRRISRVRQTVREGGLGWTYDPVRPEEMMHAFGLALASSTDEMNRMRDQCRAMVRNPASESFPERVRAAVAAMLPRAVAPGAATSGAARMS